jgi:hypothetical protein
MGEMRALGEPIRDTGKSGVREQETSDPFKNLFFKERVNGEKTEHQ